MPCPCFCKRSALQTDYGSFPIVVLVTKLCPTLHNPMVYPMVAHQAPLIMGFSRQEYWSGLPFPSPRDVPHLGFETGPPALAGEFF